QSLDRCLSPFLRIVLHVDGAIAKAVRNDFRRTGRLAAKHTLVAEKPKRHHADLAGILHRVRRRNRRRDGQNKGDERRTEPADPVDASFERHDEPRFVVATIERQTGLRDHSAVRDRNQPTFWAGRARLPSANTKRYRTSMN